ncbi:MAG: sodium-dependent transporter, partial [Oscillospiraceae bacterium]|nr:sodium-dependent transporter [Oscillospiraceae bacterium]
LSMPMSNLIGAAFFLMVIFAALTSTISLMETIMSIVQDKTGMSRAKAGWLTFALMLLIGVPTSLGFGPLSFISLNGMNLQGMLDFTANSILMPILALLTAIFIVWVVGVETVVDEVKLSSRFKKEKLFRFIIKYIVPVSMVIILVSSILDTFGIVSI